MGMRITRFVPYAIPGGILGIVSCAALLWPGAANAAAPAIDPPGSLIAPRSACGAQETANIPGVLLKQSVECMVNYARHTAGMVPLVRDSRLDLAAWRRTGDLVRCGVLPEHLPCGVPFEYRIGQAGYIGSGCWHVGENVGWSPVRTEADTVRSIFRAWMASVRHRENILHGQFRDIGIGSRIGGVFGSRSRLWVLYFGDYCPAG